MTQIERAKIPSTYRSFPCHIDHSRLAYINALVRQEGLDTDIFDNLTIFQEDNGELFLSEYYFEQKKRRKAVARDEYSYGKTDKCGCPMCGSFTTPSTNKPSPKKATKIVTSTSSASSMPTASSMPSVSLMPVLTAVAASNTATEASTSTISSLPIAVAASSATAEATAVSATAAMLMPSASATVASRPVSANVASSAPVATLPVSIVTTTSSTYTAAAASLFHTNAMHLNAM